jgi:hypothetical protein
MSKIVYLLVEQDHESTEILAAFSRSDLAETMKNKLQHPHWNLQIIPQVIKHYVDPNTPVRFDVVADLDEIEEEGAGAWCFNVYLDGEKQEDTYKYENGYLYVTVMAKSTEEAVTKAHAFYEKKGKFYD